MSNNLEIPCFVTNGHIGGKEVSHCISPTKDEPYTIPATLVVHLPEDEKELERLRDGMFDQEEG